MPKRSAKTVNTAAVEEKLSLASKRDEKPNLVELAGKVRSAFGDLSGPIVEAISGARQIGEASHDQNEFARELQRIEAQITDIDSHIGSLQLALKDAKKAREDKIGQLRGLIRDQSRPLLRMAIDEQTGDVTEATQ
jgi:hypothetical protein